jgi:hypothetical protein
VGPDGSHTFHLPAHVAPETERHTMRVSLADAWIPHTWYSVYSGNDKFDILYNDFTVSNCVLKHGNFSIDQVLEQINPTLKNDFVLLYNENRNRVLLQKKAGSTNTVTAEIVDSSSCLRLLGFHTNSSLLWAGGASPTVEGASCVNMIRTSSIFVRTTLHTENRDPVSRGIADVLGKVPVSTAYNEIIVHNGVLDSVSRLPHITYLTITLVDDFGEVLDLNGCPYSFTLEISATIENERIAG